MFTYEIIGISPAWHYVQLQQQNANTDVTYIAHQDYHLKTLVSTVLELPHKHPREQQRMLETVYEFWIDQIESIKYWRKCLAESDQDNVLISRFSSEQNLRQELEALLKK